MSSNIFYSNGARAVAFIIACVVCFVLYGGGVAAVEPRVWTLESRAELLRGEARNVSITDSGRLTLAPEFTQIFDAEQPYIWSSVADNRGNVYLGTGHEGRVYRVAPDTTNATGAMRGALVFDSEELDVFALAVAADGTLYAGTSPDGRVYRIGGDGKAEIFFDPPERYIWSLAVMPDGALAVGTGDGGRIYRVTNAGQTPATALLVDTTETHILSLAVDRAGRLVAGTDPGGLVLQVGADGKLFALLDVPLREIRALVPSPDGALYALAIADAANTATSRGALTASASTPTVTVTSSTFPAADVIGSTDASSSATTATGAARSRSDLTTARSAVFKILPDGGADVVWSSATATAFALAAQSSAQGGVMIGTNERGRIYGVAEDGRSTLLVQATEGQISSFATSGAGVFAATSNAGKLFRLQPGQVAPTGSYESPVEDAKFTADWGRLAWRGAGAIQLQTRSGNTETPDATWSVWAGVAPDGTANGGRVVSPRARFIQWRVLFGGNAAATTPAAAMTAASAATSATEANTPITGAASGAPFVEGVRLVYLPRNVRPEVLSVMVLPPNVALQSLLLPGSDQTPDAANFSSVTTGATPAISPPPRRTFQRGALSLQWQAEDRNGDALEYAIYYRALDEQTFRLLKDRVRDSFYTIDAQTLPDGRYVFRVVASDAPANPADRRLTGERTSEPVDLDNTPPLVRVIEDAAATGADGGRAVRFGVEDATGTIRRADVSINGGTWQPIYPEDGIADSRAETYLIRLPPTSAAAEPIVALRAFDRSGNSGTARVVVRR